MKPSKLVRNMWWSLRRFPGRADLSVGDQRVHVGHGLDHRGGAAEGAAGAELRGGESGGEPVPDRAALARRARARRRARRRLLRAAAAAQGHSSLYC